MMQALFLLTHRKKDGSSNELTIQILKDGKVVKESSTTAEYGVAQVSASV